MASSFVSEVKRSHYAGALRASHDRQKVVLMGWVDGRRDHGGLVFIDIRDREGLVQVVLDPSNPLMTKAKDLRAEFVIAIQGEVQVRPDGMKNSKISTGDVEVRASELAILSEAKTPPFQIDDPSVSETLRLKHRYLEIRSQRLKSNLIERHKIVRLVRNFLSDNGFIEVETPILYKSTPEGARDYLVPSRVNQGMFYALPQSPQTLKQLLMIGGIDRYFQIARCFRDEDLRADRQPEFSQIDIEMSFVDQDDVMAINERLAQVLWKTFRGVDIGPIPRLSFLEAMNRYGCDKPDTRFGLELVDLTDLARGSGFQVFDDAAARGACIKGIGLAQAKDLSRAQIDKLVDVAKRAGAKGVIWIKGGTAGLTSSAGKNLSPEKLSQLHRALNPSGEGLSLIVADQFEVACGALSALRLQLGRDFKLIDESKDQFLWVVDFPLLERDAEAGRWVARHHPFTSPSNQDLETLTRRDETKYGEVLAKAYDLVCNGHEIAGGSIRIHSSAIQDAMFAALGLSPEEAKEKFGFFIEALQYGTPPHGGIAWGVDRLVMILCNTDAIRDVIAFPKTAKATDLMAEAPSAVSREQLIELGIRLL